jgi:2-keto-4-pentenoate hydratase/2-oxohepta-3-ene-1,7-dioic acid hydratase in catechol pathway
MRIVVFGSDHRVGAWAGDQIVELNAVDAAIPAGLEAFIAAGPAALEAAQRAIERAASAPAGAVQATGSVQLHAPWPGRRIACVGGNYAAHLRGMEAGRAGVEQATLEQITERTRAAGQWGFWKVPFEVAGPEDEIPFPGRTKYFDYEGEAAIVIGRRGKDIPAARLNEYVWGITLLNDWSIREGGGGPVRPMSYNLPKNFDRSTSMGPSIVVGELQPQDVDVELRINGDVRQKYNTRDMVFSFAEVLEELSRDFTFVPGDVISGGTSEGTAQDKTKRGPDGSRSLDLFLKVGDVVELSSPKIGLLRNRIVQA